MARYDMLRVSLLGGYNKNDVHDYIQSLENEIESIKVMYQQEQNALQAELDRQAESCMTEEERQDLQKVIGDQKEELERIRAQLETTMEAYEKADRERTEKDRILAEQKKIMLEQERLLQEEKEKRESLKAREEEAEQKIKNAADQKKTGNLELENQKMKKELEELRAALQEKEKELQKARQDGSCGFLDMDTIRKVLDDANENAELIRQEAEQEKAKILQEANREAELQKKNIASKIHTELEEKGIQLMAARHKIDKYVRELKNAQQGLYMIYSRMNQMVENMPTRVDDYWEEEDKWMLPENTGKEKIEENMQEQKSAETKKAGETCRPEKDRS